MLSLAVVDHWEDAKRLHWVGTITASGNYTATTGDSIPLAAFNNPSIKSGSSPVWASAQGLGGYNYVVTYVPGATGMAAVLRIFVDSTGLELVSGAYPVGVSGNPINLYCIFPKHI